VAKPFPLKKVMGKHNKQKAGNKANKPTKSFCDEPKTSPGLEILYTSKPIPQKVVAYLDPHFTKAQTYFSSLEKIFTNLNPGKSEGFLLNTAEWIQDISGFVDPYRFQGMVGPLDGPMRPANLFMKRAHILNPISYMSGEYVHTRGSSSTSERTYESKTLRTKDWILRQTIGDNRHYCFFLLRFYRTRNHQRK